MNVSGLVALEVPLLEGIGRTWASSSKALAILVGACPKEGSVG